MPIEEDNWSDLMKKVKTLAYKIKNEERASYNFRNVYFLDEMLTAHEKVRIFESIIFKHAAIFLSFLIHVNLDFIKVLLV